MCSDPSEVRSFLRDHDPEQPDGELTFQEAIHAVATMKMEGPDIAEPIVKYLDPGRLKIGDLPLRFLNIEAGNTVVQFGDMIMGHERVKFEELQSLEKLLKKCNYKAMPEPFRLKTEPACPYYLQLFIITDTKTSEVAAGHGEAAPPPVVEQVSHILKMVTLSPNKLHVNIVKKLCYGQALQVDYGKQFRVGTMALEYMLNEIGGFQSRLCIFSPKHQKQAKKEKPDKLKLIMGFRYIKERGPTSNNDNEFVEWTELEVIDEDSPLFGWERGLVKECLSNRAKSKSMAKTLTKCPSTLIPPSHCSTVPGNLPWTESYLRR